MQPGSDPWQQEPETNPAFPAAEEFTPPPSSPFVPPSSPPAYPHNVSPYQTSHGFPPPAYGSQPAYTPQAPPPGVDEPQNTLGLVGMTLGIGAIPLLCCFSLGFPVGIAAVVVSWFGFQKTRMGTATNQSQALAGIICGAFATLTGLAALIDDLNDGTWSFLPFGG